MTATPETFSRSDTQNSPATDPQVAVPVSNVQMLAMRRETRSVEQAIRFCAMGLIPGWSGLYRFYMGRPVSGLIYTFTLGFLGFGILYDLCKVSKRVRQHNTKVLGG